MNKNYKLLMDDPIVVVSPDRAVWKQVADAKEAFILDGVTPQPDKYITPEVIESWARSKEYGVDWRMLWPPESMPEAEFKKVYKQNLQLLNAVKPFVDSYSEILEKTGYNMILYDNNCTIIMQSQNMQDEKIPISHGSIRSEQVTGNMAHTMAVHYKRPVQIIGPVNYCETLKDNITSAAPILNEYGDVLGCLVLLQWRANEVWLLGHSLGWVSSTAMAISSQLRLYRRDSRLKVMDDTLKAALGKSRNAYISIDERGYIVNFNDQAAKLLKINQKAKTPIFNILKDPSCVHKVLTSGQPLYNQAISFNSGAKLYVAHIEPFLSGKRVSGAAIKVFLSDVSKEEPNVTFENIIHESAAMRNLIETANLIAKKPVNILLLGESGTGKELFARAIHNTQSRGPFIAINCAAIPANLIESELFGYEKGAFTGADRAGKKGKIEMANDGTLFLDEIGDMPLELQSVFLRVLEEKQLMRVGGTKNIQVNFRIISATNRSLYDDVRTKLFRGDLYFRLAVVNLEIPPLREREDDAVFLAEELIRMVCNRFELPRYKLTAEAKSVIKHYNWPGNVRQLENAMTYAVSFAKNQVIVPENLPKEVTAHKSQKSDNFSELKELEIQIILKTIDEAGSTKKAAEKLGISRATLYRKLQSFKKTT